MGMAIQKKINKKINEKSENNSGFFLLVDGEEIPDRKQRLSLIFVIIKSVRIKGEDHDI